MDHQDGKEAQEDVSGGSIGQGTPNVVAEVLDWLRAKEIGVLNTSGPGGLKVPGIH
jgi:hypothetical protein